MEGSVRLNTVRGHGQGQGLRVGTEITHGIIPDSAGPIHPAVYHLICAGIPRLSVLWAAFRLCSLCLILANVGMLLLRYRQLPQYLSDVPFLGRLVHCTDDAHSRTCSHVM